MIKFSKKIYLLSFLLLISAYCYLSAQNVTVKAKIDSAQMWIGNQTNLQFEVSQPTNKKVIFPIFSDTVVTNLEIINSLQLDTQVVSDDRINIKANYLVTSFEDTLVYIPKFPFVTNGDTMWSNSLSINVIQPFVVDTTSHQLADIKPVYKPPFDWKSYLQTLALIILIIALLAFIIFLIIKNRKKSGEKSIKQLEPELPAHIEALNHLDKIKEEKIWQKGRIKEYHIELTDVVRHYIRRVFNINSMEMTSYEILKSLDSLNTGKKDSYEALRQMLTLADLVKFAKYRPDTIENERSLANAYLFVNQTKIEEKDNSSETNTNKKNNSEEV